MESIDDSGIDSDPKTPMNGDVEIKQPTKPSLTSSASQALANIRRGTDLQKKIQKQRDANRRSYEPLSKKSQSMVSRSRLLVPPSKTGHVPLPTTEQPLVFIASDDSADEDEPMFSAYKNSEELTRQLIKDGYNLDLGEDDELDLIPPKPMNKSHGTVTSLHESTTSLPESASATLPFKEQLTKSPQSLQAVSEEFSFSNQGVGEWKHFLR